MPCNACVYVVACMLPCLLYCTMTACSGARPAAQPSTTANPHAELQTPAHCCLCNCTFPVAAARHVLQDWNADNRVTFGAIVSRRGVLDYITNQQNPVGLAHPQVR